MEAWHISVGVRICFSIDLRPILARNGLRCSPSLGKKAACVVSDAIASVFVRAYSLTPPPQALHDERCLTVPLLVAH